MKDKSLFAKCLTELLADNSFTREEWCGYIFLVEGISCNGSGCMSLEKANATIESWLNDEAIPHSHDLSMIHLFFKNYSHNSQRAYDHFLQMCYLPARDVSPFGNRMLPTVWAYMKRPAFSELSSRLVNMSDEEQGKYLEELFPA